MKKQLTAFILIPLSMAAQAQGISADESALRAKAIEARTEALRLADYARNDCPTNFAGLADAIESAVKMGDSQIATMQNPQRNTGAQERLIWWRNAIQAYTSTAKGLRDRIMKC